MSKRLLFIVLFICTITFSPFSQFNKGMRMPGISIGSVFANSGKTDYSFPAPTTGYTSTQTRYGITLNPGMGWFITDNTAVGAQLILGYNKNKQSDESAATGNVFSKNNTNSFHIGLGGFARNYFSSSSSSLKPFAQFGMNLGLGSSSHDGFSFSGNDKSTFEGKSSGDFFANAGLSLGFTKLLNAHTGLDFFAGYNYSYNKSTYKTTTLVDTGNNGSIDQTTVSEPTSKFSNHGFAMGIGFLVFLDAGK